MNTFLPVCAVGTAASRTAAAIAIAASVRTITTLL
jgi:hypothetical protein